VRSITGFVTTLGCSPIVWISQLQIEIDNGS